MNFIKQQVDAGIKPQKNHYWGQEFLDRKFAVMIEGSWLPSWLPQSFFQRQSLETLKARLVLFQRSQYHIKIIELQR